MKRGRPTYRKPNHRQQIRENIGALRFLSFSAPDGKVAPDLPVIAPVKPRIRKPSDPMRILERHVLKAALQLLRTHPKVASVERTNSGLYYAGDRPVRVGFIGKLDITGMLKGGRYFEFEAKRPGGRLTPAQERRIADVRAQGGLAGWFTNINELEALLR